MRAKFLLMLIAVVVSSCSVLSDLTTTPVMDTAEPGLNAEWQGCRYVEIVRSFGAPTRTVSDGDGGTIYVYEDIKTTYSISTSTLPIGNSIDSETTAKTSREFTEFYVDANDACYLVRSNRKISTGRRRFSPLKTFGSVFLIGCFAAGIGAAM